MPTGLAALSEEDSKALQEAEDAAISQELREAEELLNSEPTLLGLPSFLSHPMMGAMAIGMLAVLGLFLFNQVTTTLANIAAIPAPWCYFAYAGVALLGIAAAYALIRFFWMYYRVRKNKQLRLQGLEELEKRTKLRWLVNAKTKEAKSQLESYMREYPLEPGKARKKLLALGFEDSVAAELFKCRELLLDSHRWPSDDVWFSEFRDTFQLKLDEVAARRIRYWAKRIALATAASPNHLTDTLITLSFSFTMLADLCGIYNLRAGRLGTAVLLTRVFFNSYLAGQLSEMEGLTADQIQDLLTPHLPVSELFLSKILGKLGAKAGTGAINYFLLGRLGKYGCRLLRPVNRGV